MDTTALQTNATGGAFGGTPLHAPPGDQRYRTRPTRTREVGR